MVFECLTLLRAQGTPTTGHVSGMASDFFGSWTKWTFNPFERYSLPNKNDDQFINNSAVQKCIYILNDAYLSPINRY